MPELKEQELRNNVPFWQRPDKKVTTDLIVSLLTFGVAAFGLELTPELSAVIGKVAGFAAAYLKEN